MLVPEIDKVEPPLLESRADHLARQGYRLLAPGEKALLKKAATLCGRLGWLGYAFMAAMVAGMLATVWTPAMGVDATVRMILGAAFVVEAIGSWPRPPITWRNGRG